MLLRFCLRTIAAAWLISGESAAAGVNLRHPGTTGGSDARARIAHADGTVPRADRRRRLDFSFSSSCDYATVPPYFVSPGGNDWSSTNGWGLSPEMPFKTIQHAVDQRQPCQTIYVMPGTYRNSYYGQSLNHQNKIVDLNNVNDLKILAHSETDRPVLQFDGPAAILGGSASNPVSNIEIAGLEIHGPNESITWEAAMTNRIIKRTYYNGRGIAFWAGNHVYIHDNIVHHCPASGIRVNRGDYIEISNNEVYSNTWWSSSAESAVVLAASEHIDNVEGIKMRLNDNIVHDNINKVPYYNPNYSWDYSPIAGSIDCGSYSACEAGLIEGCPWQCRYGKESQDYIIDGMGVYVTRNDGTYLHGRMELVGNVCYGNGINGVVVHRTDRADVRMNVVYGNGVVPRLDKPESVVEDWHAGCAGKSRQPYSGLVLNNAEDVKLWSNDVAARYDDDFAFTIVMDFNDYSGGVSAGGNNKACGGIVDESIAAYVSEVEVCAGKYAEIGCGDRCHLIQWPYNMGNSYPASEAYERCEADCDAKEESSPDGCRAFSLQDDYRPNGAGNKWCFLYKSSVPPNPESCADDPFNSLNGDGHLHCSYPTTNGQFFVTRSAQKEFNVMDYVFTR